MTWNHGGDWAGFEYSTGKRPLDFSASVSPLGMPEGARLAAAAALRQAGAYPDPLCRGLRNALSGHLGVPPEQILCGNGASDLIYRLRVCASDRAGLFGVRGRPRPDRVPDPEVSPAGGQRLPPGGGFPQPDHPGNRRGIPVQSQQSHRQDRGARSPEKDPGTVRGVRGLAHPGRMLPGLSGGPVGPYAPAGTGRTQAPDPPGVYEVLRHGRTASWLLPLRRHGTPFPHGPFRPSLAGVPSGAGGGDRRPEGYRIRP